MYIDIKIQDNICSIYMNKPGTNSLDQKLLDELYKKVQWAIEQKNIKIVIIMSKLSFGFSSGLDLGSFMDNQQTVFTDNVHNAVFTSFQIVELILHSPKIFIAALSGPVIGSAMSIALSCDFRIASKNTWFWLPDVQYGGLLADGGIDILTKTVGSSKAFMITLTNDRFNINEAYNMGLIYKITEFQKFEETSFLFAKKLCGLSFNTLIKHKEIINKGLLSNFQEKQLLEILNSKDTFQRLKSYIQCIHK